MAEDDEEDDEDDDDLGSDGSLIAAAIEAPRKNEGMVSDDGTDSDDDGVDAYESGSFGARLLFLVMLLLWLVILQV